jgi:hypothetical protein
MTPIVLAFGPGFSSSNTTAAVCPERSDNFAKFAHSSATKSLIALPSCCDRNKSGLKHNNKLFDASIVVTVSRLAMTTYSKLLGHRQPHNHSP